MNNAHPSLPEFTYIRPQTTSEAVEFLAKHVGEARPLSGGTDTFVRMRDGFWKEQYLVDIKHLEGTNVLSFDENDGLIIGAGVPMNKVSAHPDVKLHYPALVEAVNSVASYQLRNRATVVGNICNASPAGDTIGMCLLLEGVLRVVGPGGEREEKLSGFFTGPGKTTLKPGDIVTQLRLPIPPAGLVGKYIKHGRNRKSDLAIVGISVVAYPDQTLNSGYRFKAALASVAPVPLIVDKIETFLSEGPLDQAKLEEAARIAMEACTPIDDVRSSALYRKMMVRNLAKKALLEVWGKLSQ